MRDAPWYPVVKITVTTQFDIDTRRDWGFFAGILIGGNNLEEAPGWSITQRSVECWQQPGPDQFSSCDLHSQDNWDLHRAQVASIFIHYHVTNESHWLRATHQGIWLVDSFLYGIHVTNAFSDGSQNEWWNCNGKYIHRYKDKCNDTSTIMFLAALFAIYCDRV